MPTINPRVNVTLSPSMDTLVSRLAELQKVSKSQVLRELLDAAEPALQRAVFLMAAAAQAPTRVHRGLAQALAAGMDAIEGALEDQIADADHSPELELQVRVKGRRPGRSRTDAQAAAGSAPAVSLVLVERQAKGRNAVETPVALTGGLGPKTRGPGQPSKRARKGA